MGADSEGGKLKADGRAGTCLAPKSVWSRFPHVLKEERREEEERRVHAACQEKTLSGFNPL